MNEQEPIPDDNYPVRGQVRLFLGYASGVGKTYTILEEAHRRKSEHGQDIVIGFVDTHDRPDTESLISDLERVKMRSIEYRGHYFEELDIERVLARRPKWVIVDDMAHVNVPGSIHARRYQDIEYLTAHGINVLTAMNIQHLTSLTDTVARITGVHIRDTVPDYVVRDIAEIVDVDATPKTLIHRIERGDVFEASKVPLALASFFTEGNLSALRELALREVALSADNSVQSFRAARGIAEPWRTTERVMVCISPGHQCDQLIRRGWRIASMLRADLVAVTVRKQSERPTDRKVLDENLKLARELNISVEEIIGQDVTKCLSQYALKNQITEIVIGHSRASRLRQIGRASIANQLIDQVSGINVLVIATHDSPMKG